MLAAAPLPGVDGHDVGGSGQIGQRDRGSSFPRPEFDDVAVKAAGIRSPVGAPGDAGQGLHQERELIHAIPVFAEAPRMDQMRKLILSLPEMPGIGVIQWFAEKATVVTQKQVAADRHHRADEAGVVERNTVQLVMSKALQLRLDRLNAAKVTEMPSAIRDRLHVAFGKLTPIRRIRAAAELAGREDTAAVPLPAAGVDVVVRKVLLDVGRSAASFRRE